MKSESITLPCPFCGRADLLGVERHPESGFRCVRCRACGAIGPAGRALDGDPHGDHEATAHWNHRASPRSATPESAAPAPGAADFKSVSSHKLWPEWVGATASAPLPHGRLTEIAGGIDIHDSPFPDDPGAQSCSDEVRAMARALLASRPPAKIPVFDGREGRKRGDIADVVATCDPASLVTIKELALIDEPPGISVGFIVDAGGVRALKERVQEQAAEIALAAAVKGAAQDAVDAGMLDPDWLPPR